MGRPDPGGDVTVVVATRDRAPTLLDTLPRHPAPLVVVDNASTDDTARVVAACRPDAELIRLPRNRGAVARTVGVRRATTRYVAFADDDSWWEPGALDRAVQILDAHPRLAVLAGRTLVGPERRTDALSELLARSPLPRTTDLPGRPVLGFLACAAVVRRDAYLAVGGFDPLIFFYGEERPLALDLAAAGWGLAYVEEVVARHVPPVRGPNPAKQRLAIRNDLLTAWTRRPLPVAARQTVAALRTGDLHRRGALDALARLVGMRPRRRQVPAQVERAVRLLERDSAVRLLSEPAGRAATEPR